MATTPKETLEVLVVGAGPVGMLTALCLSERGVRVAIVDKYRRSALHSYALALHPASLRLLDELGLAEAIVERGERTREIAVYTGGEPVATLDLGRLAGRFPFVLVLPQTLLEGALEKRLAENGVEILWGHSLLAFDDEGDSVTALVAEIPDDDAPDDAEVSTAHARASFVVGADGHDSLVRRLLPAPTREVGNRLTYGLLEFEASMEHRDRMTLIFNDRSTDVLWPLGAERGRWGVQLESGAQEIDAPRLWEIVRERAPWFDPDACTVEWLTAVSFQPRLAKPLGRGRVWLVGDAAHTAGPLGVQSMNVGLREGHDLARRLSGILREGDSSKLLRYYHDDRNREWKVLLGMHDRMRYLPDAPEWARKLAGRLVSSLPASGRDLNILLEQMGLRVHWLRRKN